MSLSLSHTFPLPHRLQLAAACDVKWSSHGVPSARCYGGESFSIRAARGDVFMVQVVMAPPRILYPPPVYSSHCWHVTHVTQSRTSLVCGCAFSSAFPPVLVLLWLARTRCIHAHTYTHTHTLRLASPRFIWYVSERYERKWTLTPAAAIMLCAVRTTQLPWVWQQATPTVPRRKSSRTHWWIIGANSVTLIRLLCSSLIHSCLVDICAAPVIICSLTYRWCLCLFQAIYTHSAVGIPLIQEVFVRPNQPLQAIEGGPSRILGA